MAVSITNYGGLVSAIAAWLARDGDTDLAARADDFIALCETRMYYGAPAVGQIPECEAIRIPEMYQSNASFALAQNAAQPAGMLELIEATVNSADVPAPMQIVEESVIDTQALAITGTPRMIALSGNNFRVWPDPGTGSYTATLRWLGGLATPSVSNDTNWILTNAPGVYLNGCLLEAALFTGDIAGAATYGTLYASLAAGLNVRAQRRLASAHNVRITLRTMTP